MLIYRFTNRVNQKVYIGQTVKLMKRRFETHRASVTRGSQQAFHCAVRKYGWNTFRLEIIHTAKSIDELNAMETFFILLHQSHCPQFGYNRSLGGYKRKNVGQIPWNKGKCGAQVAWNKGKRMSEEYREKCRKRSSPEMAIRARAGIDRTAPKSEKWRNAIRKHVGAGNPFFGKKHTPETRAKMRAAKARKLSNT